ncbi:MAG: iron-containing alcohol dehydrogenase [Candidatus Lokiarchaeota archaeon]|nr:iron-containing alcohol dehydrogenase [Candidatus Lokiarchaeota archaeon]
MNLSFNFARIPHTLFGVNKIDKIGEIISTYGKKILLVTGKSSLVTSGDYKKITNILNERDISFSRIIIDKEPSPKLINDSVARYKDKNINVVLSVGGGSVLDAGKAISAMILEKNPVEDYLEGVGNKTHSGKKVPFVAVPTTAGTGSEATKNAVISDIQRGFKKSLRHDNFIPDYAIIDPNLMISCPSQITGACGMDAFTQLVESYLSTKANPMTDALAFSGIKLMIKNLVHAAKDKSNDVDTRAAVAYAAYISGITLANVGLGTIHGFASAIGGYFDIPHGVVCGTLMADGNKITVEILNKMENKPDKMIALKKYAKLGAILEDKYDVSNDKIDHYCNLFIEKLYQMNEELKIKKLSDYGVKEEDLDNIISKASNKNNPAPFSTDDMRRLLKSRL